MTFGVLACCLGVGVKRARFSLSEKIALFPSAERDDKSVETPSCSSGLVMSRRAAVKEKEGMISFHPVCAGPLGVVRDKRTDVEIFVGSFSAARSIEERTDSSRIRYDLHAM